MHRDGHSNRGPRSIARRFTTRHGRPWAARLTMAFPGCEQPGREGGRVNLARRFARVKLLMHHRPPSPPWSSPMTRALRVCTSAAFVTACALAAPNAGAQWTEATSTVPHNAGITFAVAGARAVRVSWKPWNLMTTGLKYHLMRAADSTSAGSD